MNTKIALGLSLLAAGSPLIFDKAVAQSSSGAQRSIKLTAALEARHDSNVPRSDAAKAALRGLARADQRLSPSLSADLTLPFSDNRLQVKAGIGYDFYRRNDRLNRERLRLDSNLLLNVTPCLADISAGYIRRQSELGEIGATSAAGTDSVRNAEEIKTVGTQLSCGAPVGIRPLVGISYEQADNSNTLRQIADHRSTRYTGGVRYLQQSIGTIDAFVGRTETRNPNQILANGTKSGYRVNLVGARLQREIGALLRGSVEVSYVKLKPRAAIPSFSGANWSAELSSTFSPNLRLQAGLSRKTGSSLAVDSSYNIETLYSLKADYVLNERMTATAAYSHKPRRYVGSRALFGPLLTDDRQDVVSGALSYNRSERLKIILDIGYERRNANGTDFDYNNKRAAVRVETTI